MTKDERISIIRLDRTTWEAVCRSLRYLHNHFDVPKIGNSLKLTLTKTDVAEAMNDLHKFKPSKSSEIISISENEWNRYNHIILYNCDILPRE